MWSNVGFTDQRVIHLQWLEMVINILRHDVHLFPCYIGSLQHGMAHSWVAEEDYSLQIWWVFRYGKYLINHVKNDF